jgi:hypothetical protein
MASAAETRHVPVDWYIVGRIREKHVGDIAAHEQADIFTVTGVAAEKAVPTELPYVACSRDRLRVEHGAIVIDVLGGGWISLFGGADRNLDFANLKAADGQVEAKITELFEFNGEDVAIPASVEGQLVIGKHVRPFVLL